jgi:crossover junction endodeoxyribonuclease RuvC
MIILSLDLGTKTGWKIGDRSMNLSGVWDFSNSRFDGGGMRFVRFLKSLNELAAATKPDLVVYEEVRRHMSNDAAHTYGGFWSHLAAWCDGQDPQIPYNAVPVGRIKIFATGHGNAPKTDADKEKRNAKLRAKGKKEYDGLSVMGAMRGLGLNPQDDNESDAMALWAYAQKEFGS